jgi:outer membrane protein
MAKHFTRTLVAAVTALGLCANAHSDTLIEIYQQALENDHQFQAAQAASAAGQQNLAIGRSRLLPQIGGSYQYARRELTQNDGNGDAESTTTTKSLNAELTQPLFNLAAWYSYRRGDALADLAAAQFAQAKQNLIIRTAEAYFEALNAVDTLETAIAEESALEQQLEQTKQRFEVGLTAITEVHEAQAAYDSAVALRLLAEGDLGIAFEALEVITGRPHEQLAPLQDNFPVTKPEPADREEWVEAAAENNFALQAAALNARAAKRAARAQASEHLPTVSGRLAYSDTNSDREMATAGPGVGPGSNFLFEGEETSASIVLNVPLYSGGRISATRRQAHYQFLEARQEFFQAQRDVVQQTRSLYLSVVTSVATVKARQQAVTSSRSALEATKAGYDVGTRDLVDVLNAQRALYSAQRDYYDALYTYVLNSLRLKASAGMLSSEDVAELNQWLNPQNPVSQGDLNSGRSG